MTGIIILFWLLFFLVFYTYIGYGIVAWLLVILKRIVSPANKPKKINEYPHVTLLIAAYNEEDIVAAKMENNLQLDYPKDKLHITWVTDGSTDKTVEILNSYENITVLHSPQRGGKTAAINRAMSFIQTPIVIFTDANTMINKEAITKITEKFSDPKVGCVAGEKRIMVQSKDSASSSGEGFYWKYESTLKSLDSELYSVWGGLDQLLSNQPLQMPDTTSSSSSTSSSATSASKVSLIKAIGMVAALAAAIVTAVLLLPSGENPIYEENKILTEEAQLPLEEKSVDSVSEISPTSPLVSPKSLFSVAASPAMTDSSVTSNIEEMFVVQSDGQEEVESKEETKKAPPVPVLFAESNMLDIRSNTSSKGFSLSLAANTGLFSENVSQHGGEMLFSHNVRTREFATALEKENSEFDLEHRQPISFGLMVGKHIAPRLSIETGLVYTYLSSKITSNSTFNINESQYFHYIGIPLSLNYTFCQIGKTKFYVSVGGMVQKDIQGKYTSDMGFSIFDINDNALAYRLFYSEPYYIKKTIKQSNPQFSARTTLGISYPLYKKLYLYGTIGGSYYFDAGNKYRTIYSDKKTQLDLNLGVKFDF